jgi:hypothetical protein
VVGGQHQQIEPTEEIFSAINNHHCPSSFTYNGSAIPVSPVSGSPKSLRCLQHLAEGILPRTSWRYQSHKEDILALLIRQLNLFRAVSLYPVNHEAYQNNWPEPFSILLAFEKDVRNNALLGDFILRPWCLLNARNQRRHSWM